MNLRPVYRAPLLALGIALFACALCGPLAAQAQEVPSPPPVPSPIEHHISVALIFWILFTAIVNTLFHLFTPKDVDAWAERNPTIAWLAGLMRRAGFEPVALLTQLFAFFSSNPPPPAAFGNAAMGKRHPYREAPAVSERGAVDVHVAALIGGCALLLLACGIFRGADAPDDAKALARCEAQVAEENPEADFATFVRASLAGCLAQGVKTVADVVAWVVGTDDPHAARYKPIARATQADSAKMGALRAQVGHP